MGTAGKENRTIGVVGTLLGVDGAGLLACLGRGGGGGGGAIGSLGVVGAGSIGGGDRVGEGAA